MRQLILIISIILSSAVFSQQHIIGPFLGVSYYTGDLNPYKHFHRFKPAVGAFYKYNSRGQRYAWRIHGMYGQVEGIDSLSEFDYLKNRNLSFKSEIIELAGIMEVNFFEFDPGNIKRDFITPYLFFGIAYYRMNPKTYFNEVWTDLQPLGTEGQNTSANSDGYYRLNQVAIPLGIGVKMNLSKSITFGMEFGVRKLFTDYLDDVSKTYVDPDILTSEAGALSAQIADQTIEPMGPNNSNVGFKRGISEANDWYYFTGVTLGFIIKQNKPCYQQY